MIIRKIGRDDYFIYIYIHLLDNQWLVDNYEDNYEDNYDN